MTRGGHNFIDLMGQTFAKLTAIGRAEPTPSGKTRWLCRCECGAVIPVLASNLQRGQSRSCGCLRRDMASDLHKRHGLTGTRIHRIWKQMRQRCQNPNTRSYADYGGRGIAVCAEWDAFEAFREWSLANGYRDDLSIDRIDNDAGYSSDNCRWATSAEQAQNKRSRRPPAKPRRLKPHCKRGHLLEGENLRIGWRNGAPHRQCRACGAENARRHYHAAIDYARRQRIANDG